MLPAECRKLDFGDAIHFLVDIRRELVAKKRWEMLGRRNSIRYDQQQGPIAVLETSTNLLARIP